MIEKLMWTGEHGQLATALGVSNHRAARVERALAPILARNGSLKELFDTLETLGLSFNEWTSAVFALGYYNGVYETGGLA